MNWYIKDFSKLTNVSIRTLHHYHEIGLLIPSVRKENGYRLYSERDLLKQQQIIALKSFGFKLQEIKALIHDQKNILDNLESQAEILDQKAKSFDQASQLIKEIVAQNKNSESLNWQTTMKIIEVYKTMSKLDKTWAGKVLNAEELKSYAQFEQEMQNKSATEKAFQKRWQSLCVEIKNALEECPTSEAGMSIAEKVHGAIYNLYGKRYAGLKHAIWEKGFKSGANQDSGDHQLTPDMVQWLDAAMGAYWQNRNRNILKKIGQQEDDMIIDEFCQSLDEMYGHETKLKIELLSIIFEHPEIPEHVKSWVKANILPIVSDQ